MDHGACGATFRHPASGKWLRCEKVIHLDDAWHEAEGVRWSDVEGELASGPFAGAQAQIIRFPTSGPNDVYRQPLHDYAAEVAAKVGMGRCPVCGEPLEGRVATINQFFVVHSECEAAGRMAMTMAVDIGSGFLGLLGLAPESYQAEAVPGAMNYLARRIAALARKADE